MGKGTEELLGEERKEAEQGMEITHIKKGSRNLLPPLASAAASQVAAIGSCSRD